MHTYVSQEPDKVWYVVDASWLASWLAFVHYEKNTSPAPGPCRNDRLIVPDFEAGRFEPRPGLVLSHHGRLTGHYRLMSAAAWSLIEKCYPGSGPEIRTSFHPVCLFLGHYMPPSFCFHVLSVFMFICMLFIIDRTHPTSTMVFTTHRTGA
jgi:hypothetical protein